MIIAIGYWIIQQPWNAWTKYVAVLLGTMAICVALYEGIRRFSLTRVSFGMKIAKSSQAPGPKPSPSAARMAMLADDKA